MNLFPQGSQSGKYVHPWSKLNSFSLII